VVALQRPVLRVFAWKWFSAQVNEGLSSDLENEAVFRTSPNRKASKRPGFENSVGLADLALLVLHYLEGQIGDVGLESGICEGQAHVVGQTPVH